MTIIEALERQHRFTKTDSAIADYILSHPDAVVSLTIEQLAAATYTSRSAVLRLCKKLGSSGYRDFRVELAREFERTATTMDEVDVNRPFSEGDDTKTAIDALAGISHIAIDRTRDTLDPKEIHLAARLIAGARHVALFGVGDTMVSLNSFSVMSFKNGVICSNGFNGNDRYSMGAFLGPEDVVVMASYSGINLPDFERQLTGPLERRCKVVIITSDASARERMLGADSFILLPAGEHHENRGAYFSQACLRFALSCINAEIMLQKWDEASKMRERLMSEDQEHAARQSSVWEN